MFGDNKISVEKRRRRKRENIYVCKSIDCSVLTHSPERIQSNIVCVCVSAIKSEWNQQTTVPAQKSYNMKPIQWIRTKYHSNMLCYGIYCPIWLNKWQFIGNLMCHENVECERKKTQHFIAEKIEEFSRICCNTLIQHKSIEFVPLNRYKYR